MITGGEKFKEHRGQVIERITYMSIEIVTVVRVTVIQESNHEEMKAMPSVHAAAMRKKWLHLMA